MNRQARFSAAAIVVAWMTWSNCAIAQTTIPSGSRCWWTFTGEASTDALDLANWRWAGGGSSGAQPSGGTYVGPFGNPTSLDILLSNRLEWGATIWNPALGATLAATTTAPTGRAVIDGNSAGYIARNAAVGGVGIRTTFSGIEIDGGVQLEVINGAKYSVLTGGAAGQTGVNTGYGGLQANGYGTSPKQDYDLWVGAGGSEGTGQTFGYNRGNSQRSTIYVTTGGTFEMGTFGVINATATSPYGSLNTQGDAGIHASGLATVRVNGNYTIGQASGATGASKGGGFLTLQGYNANSVLRFGTGSNTLEMRPAQTTSTPLDRLQGWTQPAELNVILDATNNAGQFNTAVADTLRVWPQGTGSPVMFNVNVSGYAPVVGHVFPIITATTLSDGTNTGVLGAMSKGWSTPFTSGDGTFQFLQSYNGQQGVFLEVVSVVPEPGSIGLLAAGLGLSAWACVRRRFRRLK